jgi:hypothetical protein
MIRKPSEEVLPTIAMPCLLCVGEADGRDAGAKPCVTPMPNVTCVSWPGLKRAEGFFRRDRVPSRHAVVENGESNRSDQPSWQAAGEMRHVTYLVQGNFPVL